MRTRLTITFFTALIIVLLLAACQPEASVAELPTLAVVATNTPSDTPTTTFTPTATDTATSTATPTNTATFTPSTTATATATFTPSITATFTETPTSTSTSTNTAEPTSATPRILSFTTSSTNVLPNEAITLRWAVNADIARIDELNAQATVLRTFSVTVPTGQLQVAVPGTAGNVVIYQITASRGGVDASTAVTINVACATPWFFGAEFATPFTSQCPGTGMVSGPGAFQPFERGVAIYFNANNLNRVCGLENNGSRYFCYNSAWNPASTPTPSTPPAGLLAPQGVFDWLYYSTTGPSGAWSTTIGWATANIDNSNRSIQYEVSSIPNPPFYVDAPGGAVYRFSGGDSGTWSRVR